MTLWQNCNVSVVKFFDPDGPLIHVTEPLACEHLHGIPACYCFSVFHEGDAVAVLCRKLDVVHDGDNRVPA